MKFFAIVVLISFMFQSKYVAVAEVTGGAAVNQEEGEYSVPTLVLFGDDSYPTAPVPLKKIAVIDMRDMIAFWDGLGIDRRSAWEPNDPYGMDRGYVQKFPMLYSALGYIMFQREYRSEQLEKLIVECQQGKELVAEPTAKRVVETLLKAALLQSQHGGSLILRAGMRDCSDSETCPKQSPIERTARH